MYLPALFAEANPEVLTAFLRQHPLAFLITQGPEGPEASPVPLLYDPTPTAEAPAGTLLGHLARANPQWRRHQTGVPVLALFQGENAYVSPTAYPSKQEHGKVVPTWNYQVVEARGSLHVADDPETLRGLLTRLTHQQEAAAPHPWQLSDAPADYLQSMLKAVVGAEIRLQTLTGKWKMSQNRSPADRAGVAAHLAQSPDPGVQEVAREVARLAGLGEPGDPGADQR